jgi:small-conductance mechanosensitive channel
MIDAFTSYLAEIVWIIVIAAMAVVAVLALRYYVRRTGAEHQDLQAIARRAERALITVVILAAIRIALIGIETSESHLAGAVAHVLSIAFIIAIVWLVAESLIASEGIILSRFAPASDMGEVAVRKVRTQITLVRRLIVALVVVLGAGAILMTFPAIRVIGQGLLASAGLISIVAGLAAQTTLTNVFAGIQLTLSSSLRVGDVVSVENQSGVVGEITLTYVVINLWDERRLILPSSYFVTQPFENWTRSGGRMIGVVHLDVDWSVPLDELRAELDRSLSETPLWDGRTATMTVSDVQNGRVRLRIGLSASSTGDMFALNAHVREAMVRFIADHGGAWAPRLSREDLTRMVETPE